MKAKVRTMLSCLFVLWLLVLGYLMPNPLWGKLATSLFVCTFVFLLIYSINWKWKPLLLVLFPVLYFAFACAEDVAGGWLNSNSPENVFLGVKAASAEDSTADGTETEEVSMPQGGINFLKNRDINSLTSAGWKTHHFLIGLLMAIGFLWFFSSIKVSSASQKEKVVVVGA